MNLKTPTYVVSNNQHQESRQNVTCSIHFGLNSGAVDCSCQGPKEVHIKHVSNSLLLCRGLANEHTGKIRTSVQTQDK